MEDLRLAPSYSGSTNYRRSRVHRISPEDLKVSGYIRNTFEVAMTKDQNQAIEETVKKEGPRLLDFIRRRIPDVDDAEDILQDVFYQLIESYRLTKPIEEVAAWLFTVARNKITDRFRKKKPESLEKQLLSRRGEEDGEMLNLAEVLPSSDSPPDVLMLRTAVMEELEEALDELPKEQRDIFMLHEIDGKSFKEISEMTGESVNTLLSRKRYAILFLRKRLKGLYKELIYN